MKVSREWRGLSNLLAELGTPEWRRQWWQKLTVEHPQVAARLIRKFPHQFPGGAGPLAGAPTFSPEINL